MSRPSPDRREPGRLPVDAASDGPTALVGRAVAATIAEPWDFSSTAGQNVLTGRIVAVAPPTAATQWIFCEVSPFAEGRVTISTVTAVRRYAGEEPTEQLRLRGEASVQLVYDPASALLTPERIDAALQASPGGLKHLIGTLRLT